eukprot:TRINITY_DN1586_c0_g1_i1.p1 TRINITY_DN1586_c0_g1~~TRINITY_DN1586_c0_g1_i1.p1  ORF type:complete len:107 (-),score=45.07 TRINITY_DN1586_c0_g1_i1:44-364(-)
MSNNEELATTYAALLLHDAGVEVTAELLTAITASANVKVSNFWPAFYEKALKTNNLDTIISNVGTGSAAPAAASAGAAAAAPAAAVEAAKEPSSESEEEMDGFDLF